MISDTVAIDTYLGNKEEGFARYSRKFSRFAAFSGKVGMARTRSSSTAFPKMRAFIAVGYAKVGIKRLLSG